MRIENQQKIVPMGHLYGVTVDIEDVSALDDFEVVKIEDDSNPYLVLLGIDQDIDMNRLINLKKKKMSFEKNSLKVIMPLDPAEGTCYTELV